MLRINTAQKECGLPQSNKQLSSFSLENSNIDPLHTIKTMLKTIKIKSGENMDEETKAQFSKIVDVIVQMVEEAGQ